MVAWLITMVPGIDQRIITVLNHRLSGKTVAQIMEQLYVHQLTGNASRLRYAKTRKSDCPARMAIVDGLPYADEWWCGSGDRFFWARRVKDLQVTTDEHGNERMVWIKETP